MTTIGVHLKDNAYDIVIGQKILRNLGAVLKPLNLGDDALVITDPVIEGLHGRSLARGLAQAGFSAKFFTVPVGEKSKSVRQAFALLERVVPYSAGKNLFIVALGGGVVGDLSGFVAAVYKRGIPYIQVPTTLLAQIDSAIGGKTAVDLPVGKNLVGAFYQPRLVFSDIAVLSTLNRRQIRNGLAEAVKYGVICDRGLFQTIEQNVDRLLSLEPKILSHVVADCSRIKAKIVTSDEKETKGVRTILNFGHTVGHAVEAAGLYRVYHHGEAVALGMRVAADLSRRLNLLSGQEAARIGEVLTRIGLPQKIRGIHLQDILRHMRHDKKFKGKKNRFVLATGIGSVKVVAGIPPRLIVSAIKTYMGRGKE